MNNVTARVSSSCPPLSEIASILESDTKRWMQVSRRHDTTRELVDSKRVHRRHALALSPHRQHVRLDTDLPSQGRDTASHLNSNAKRFHVTMVTQRVSLVNTQRDGRPQQNAHTYSVNIGDRIRECRRRRELTQEQLAHRCGFASASRIGNYENGSRQPSIDAVTIIAKSLGVSASYLATGEQPRHEAREPPTAYTAHQADVAGAIRQLSEAIAHLDNVTREAVAHLLPLLTADPQNASVRRALQELLSEGDQTKKRSVEASIS